MRRTEPAALASQLRGDLDWIATKALEKDRARRYQTASELARDIERHLSSEPVEAGPPSTVYRIQKFIQRHKLGVSITALALAALVAVMITTTLQSRRIAAERDRANHEAATADQVADFLEDLASGAGNKFLVRRAFESFSVAFSDSRPARVEALASRRFVREFAISIFDLRDRWGFP